MSLSPQRVDLEKVWAEVAEAASRIITLTPAKGMPLVENIYKLCTAHPQPYSEEVYNRLRLLLEARVDALCAELHGVSGEALLIGYEQRWSTYSLGTDYLHHIFRYLNQHWIRKRLDEQHGGKAHGNQVGVLPGGGHGVYEVGTLALVAWRDRLVSAVQQRLVAALVHQVHRVRDGHDVPLVPLRTVGTSLIRLGGVNRAAPLELYRRVLEGPYCAAVRDYYEREVAHWLQHETVAAYVTHAERRLADEAQLAARLLDPSSAEPVRQLSEQVLIAQPESRLIGDSTAWLERQQLAELRVLHTLLGRIDRRAPLADLVQQHVAQMGMSAVENLSEVEHRDPKRYVDTLLAVLDRALHIVRTAFSDDALFVAALDRGVRTLLNDNAVNRQTVTRSAELLAKYCDLLLKKGSRAVDSSELEGKLGQLVQLFKYLHDKDVFQKFYTKLLARRLIQESSVSDDAERWMLQALRSHAGYEYVAKLHRMFTDMQLAHELHDKFTAWLADRGMVLQPLTAVRNAVEFSVSVLTAGSWPLQTQPSSFLVPAELEPCLNAFSAYYAAEHQGRRLSWLHALGKAELRTTFLAKRYELLVSNYQLAVLLAFNAPEADGGLTLDYLSSATGLKDAELRRTVQSLVELKLLLASPPVEPYTPMHAFSLNYAFSSKRLKLKVLGAMQKETGAQESEETHKAVDDERRLYVQAAIVRIMKARKQLSHAALVQEVIQQAAHRFQVQVPLIKKCVEFLIEKEYLRRADGVESVYQYLA